MADRKAPLTEGATTRSQLEEQKPAAKQPAPLKDISKRQDPTGSVQWQEAVDLADALLMLDSARAYGLVTGGPAVNIERCDEILKRGHDLGFRPTKDAIKRLLRR